MSEREYQKMATATNYETYMRSHIDTLEAEVRELGAELNERWRKLDRALSDLEDARKEIKTLSEQLKHAKAENRYLVFGDDSEESG